VHIHASGGVECVVAAGMCRRLRRVGELHSQFNNAKTCCTI
jgi:hypothetical protein